MCYLGIHNTPFRTVGIRISLSTQNISSDRFSILSSRLHICIIPVWQGFKARRLRQRRASSKCQSRSQRWRSWSVEVDILCLKPCSSVKLHPVPYILLASSDLSSQASCLHCCQLGPLSTYFSPEHSLKPSQLLKSLCH